MSFAVETGHMVLIYAFQSFINLLERLENITATWLKMSLKKCLRNRSHMAPIFVPSVFCYEPLGNSHTQHLG